MPYLEYTATKSRRDPRFNWDEQTLVEQWQAELGDPGGSNKGCEESALEGDWVKNQFTLPTQVYRYKANQVESKEQFSSTPA